MNVHTRTSLGANRYQITASLSPGEDAPATGDRTVIDGMGALAVESVRIVRQNLRFRAGEELYDVVVRVLEPSGRRLSNR